MSNIVAKEPVRVYMYSVLAAVLAVLVVMGAVHSDMVPVLLAAVSAILGIPAVEVARSKVTPVE